MAWCRERERHVHDIPLVLPINRKSAALEDSKHRLIVCKYVRLEDREARLLSNVCKMPQEEGSNAASSIRLCNNKSQLGVSQFVPLYCGVAAIADHDLLAISLRDCRQQGNNLAEIQVGDLFEFRVR